MSCILALFLCVLAVDAGQPRSSVSKWHRFLDLAPPTGMLQDPDGIAIEPDHGPGEWKGRKDDPAPTQSRGGKRQAEDVNKVRQRKTLQYEEQEEAESHEEIGMSRRGYLPVSSEESQGTILCGLIAMLIPAVVLCASSCWRAHHQTQMPTPSFLLVLGEKRTMHLIIIPVLASITTMTMTWLNYKWYQHSLDTPLPETYYVSQAINFRRVEPWSAWLARWSIWFLVVFGVVEFKGEILPWELMWLPLMWAMALLSVIASGIHQYDVNKSYEKPVWGIGGGERLLIHVVCAIFAFVVCWLESVMFWWPNKTLHICYGGLVVVFILMPWESVKITIEWVILAAHLLIVWYRSPLVQLDVQRGTWRPWVGCCHCCCPFVEVSKGGTNWNPPVSTMSEKADVMGEPVRAGR